MVNRFAVLWCGRDLWVETAHSNLPCFASCRKTTPNKQRVAKPYEMVMNWAQVTEKKHQPTQVYVVKFISIFIPIFLRFYNYIIFSYNRNMRGNLCTDIMLPVMWLNISNFWVCNVTRWTTDTKICRGGGRKEFPKLLRLSVKNTSSSESLISFW